MWGLQGYWVPCCLASARANSSSRAGQAWSRSLVLPSLTQMILNCGYLRRSGLRLFRIQGAGFARSIQLHISSTPREAVIGISL